MQQLTKYICKKNLDVSAGKDDKIIKRSKYLKTENISLHKMGVRI